jgi:FCD domain
MQSPPRDDIVRLATSGRLVLVADRLVDGTGRPALEVAFVAIEAERIAGGRLRQPGRAPIAGIGQAPRLPEVHHPPRTRRLPCPSHLQRGSRAAPRPPRRQRYAARPPGYRERAGSPPGRREDRPRPRLSRSNHARSPRRGGGGRRARTAHSRVRAADHLAWRTATSWAAWPRASRRSPAWRRSSSSRVWTQVHRARLLWPSTRRRLDETWKEHAELVVALRARDPDRAEQLMRTHLERARASTLDRMLPVMR